MYLLQENKKTRLCKTFLKQFTEARILYSDFGTGAAIHYKCITKFLRIRTNVPLLHKKQCRTLLIAMP